MKRSCSKRMRSPLVGLQLVSALHSCCSAAKSSCLPMTYDSQGQVVAKPVFTLGTYVGANTEWEQNADFNWPVCQLRCAVTVMAAADGFEALQRTRTM